MFDLFGSHCPAGKMRRALLTRAAGLVIASAAAGCRSSPSTDASRQPEGGAASKAQAGAAADTAFVEERRYEERGARTPDGRCRWPSDSVVLPAGGQRVNVRRTVSVDNTTCVRVVAAGYRNALPLEDATGTAGASASAGIDLRSPRGATPLRRP